MALAFTKRAKRDLECWDRSGRAAIKERVETLLKSISADPYSGIGKPEPLKHELSGCWSRRVNSTHRLVHKITDDAVVIVSLRYHY